MKWLLFPLLLSCSALRAACCFDGDPSYPPCPEFYIEDARLEFSGFTGNFISINRPYGTFGVVKPLSVFDEDRPFLDFKGYVFNNARWAANGGLGYRYRLSYCNVIGVNAYYDYRRSDCKHSYNQVGFGLEWLTDLYDIQLNTYFPVGKTKNFCFYSWDWGYEYALSGFDLSFGAPLFSYRGFNLYASGGTYYMTRPHNHFWGGFGTLELDWKTLISVGVRISNDRIYGKNAQGMVQLSIPLELFYCAAASECYSCRDLFSLPVRRIGLILFDRCHR